MQGSQGIIVCHGCNILINQIAPLEVAKSLIHLTVILIGLRDAQC